MATNANITNKTPYYDNRGGVNWSRRPPYRQDNRPEYNRDNYQEWNQSQYYSPKLQRQI